MGYKEQQKENNNAVITELDADFIKVWAKQSFKYKKFLKRYLQIKSYVIKCR